MNEKIEDQIFKDEGIGISWEEQKRAFTPERLDGILENDPIPPTPETAERAFKNATEVFPHQMESIKNAKDIIELQKAIVILNLNEFKLRDNPTEAEFLDLLNDSIRYGMGLRSHFTGPKAEEMFTELEKMIEQETEAIEEKYKELTS